MFTYTALIDSLADSRGTFVARGKGKGDKKTRKRQRRKEGDERENSL